MNRPEGSRPGDAPHVRDQRASTAAVIGSGMGFSLLLLLAFAALAAAVYAGFTQAFDERVLIWVAGHRNPALDYIMPRLTTLGAGIVLIMIVLVSATFLWLTHHRWSAYLLVAGVAGGIIFNNILKLIFARPRPDAVEWGDQVVSLSFPSGHAMSSIIVYGSVAYLVSRLEPTRTMRTTTWIVAALLILGIGFSRTYLGVHYPTDVLGGFLAGAAWVALAAASGRAARYFGR